MLNQKHYGDPFQPPAYISTFEVCQMASQSVYILHLWITLQTTASLRTRLCVRTFTTKWQLVVYLTCQQICEMAEMPRLSLRQSDWIFSLWLNVVYLPVKETRYKVVIFTSGKKLKMMADYYAGQMDEDGRSKFPYVLKLLNSLLSLSLGHKVEWEEISSSMKRRLKLHKKKGRPRLRAGCNYFDFLTLIWSSF